MGAARRALISREFPALVSVDANAMQKRAPMDTTTLVARRERALGAGAPLFYDTPLHIVRGEGVYLFDADRPPLRRHVQQRAVRRARQSRMSSRRCARQQATLNVHSRYLHEGHRRLRRTPRGPPRARRSRASSSAVPGPRPTRWRCAWRVRDRQARHRLHQRHLSRQQRGGRQDDPHRRRPATAAGDVRAIPFPEKLRPLVPGASEARARWRPISTRLREAIRSLEEDGMGFAGLIVCSIFANEGLPDVPHGLHGARGGDRCARPAAC